MSNGSSSIASHITQVREQHPFVTDAASARITELVSGPGADRPLSPTDLAAIAKALMIDMLPPAPQVEPEE